MCGRAVVSRVIWGRSVGRGSVGSNSHLSLVYSVIDTITYVALALFYRALIKSQTRGSRDHAVYDSEIGPSKDSPSALTRRYPSS